MRAAVTAAAVCATAYAGVLLTIPHGPFYSPLWPASGVALAALLLWGPWMLPAIYAGLAANHALCGFHFLTMWIAPLGAILEAGAAAWILMRVLGPKPRLTDLRGCLAYLVLAPWLPALINALYEIGPRIIEGGAENTHWERDLAVFVMANGASIALLTPAVMVWKTKPEASWWRRMALTAPLCAIAAVAVFAITPGVTPCILFPVLIAAALALGLRGAAPLIALVSVIAAAGTTMAFPPLAGPDLQMAGYVWMYIVLGLLAGSVMPVAALIDRYRGSLRRISGAAHVSNLVLWSWEDGKGLTVEANGGTRLAVAGSLDPFDDTQEQGCREVEIQGRAALSSWVVTRRHPGGKPLEIVGTLVDLFDRKTAEQARRQAWQSEVELRNLRANLTPHLLFNCLAAVRGIVRTEPERARAFIDHLSRFLRQSTNTQSRRTIPLLDEWQLCEDFLGLQALRYERELPRLVDIQGPAYHARIPPMILLTLVENAVKHGEVSQSHPLAVAARLHGGHLEFTVRNHGQLGRLPTERPGGLGVSRARLEAIYGEKASLEIRQEGDDVVVAGKLPAADPAEPVGTP